MSRIFRWVLGSKWSHTFIVVGEIEQLFLERLCCETTSFEVAVSPVDIFYTTNPKAEFEVYRHTAFGTWERSRIARRAVSMCGMVYAWWKLPLLGIRGLMKKLGLRVPVFPRAGVICYDVPIYAYEDHYPEWRDQGLDTEELYQAVKSNPRFARVYGTSKN